MSSATIVKEAIWLEENGADVIIAQGAEAGGHRGMFLTDNIAEQPGTFALVPQVVDAVKVPVIAAGGIADGRGIAAAFALGAAGVQIGSAYLRCPESKVIAPARAALAQAHDDSTVITNVMTGRPARGVANRVMREVGPISPDAPAFPARRDRARTAEGGGRKARQGRFHQSLGRAGGAARPRDAGGRADPGAGRRRAGAAEPDGRLIRRRRRGCGAKAASAIRRMLNSPFRGLYIMSVDAATVRRIAHLARIAVTEAEVPHLQGELNAMLAFVEQLSEVNVDGVEPMTSVTPMEMKKRADVVNDGEIADDIVRNAPATRRPFLPGAEGRRIAPIRDEIGSPMCLLCDDEKAYQAYMNYLDAMERQGKAADPDKAMDAVLDALEADERTRPQAGRPGQRQDAFSVLLQPDQ